MYQFMEHASAGRVIYIGLLGFGHMNEGEESNVTLTYVIALHQNDVRYMDQDSMKKIQYNM